MRWDPEQYLRFADERGRPFRDLVGRVAATEPRLVADLGCGPGNLTVELARRWPSATVVGVDDSPEMVERARGGSNGEVDFVLADARAWEPTEPVDVIVSNATLQWISGHLPLLDRLVGFLAPDGWLAFQVPGNFGEPSHTELAAVADDPRWRDRLAGRARPSVEEPTVYLERLAGLGLRVDAWETTYLQVLQGSEDGEDAVLEWMRGTGLRPVLSALDPADRAAFETEYAARLRRAYPRQDYGTVLPYRRIFVVAHGS